MQNVQSICNQGVILRNGQIDFIGKIGDAVKVYQEDR